MCGLNDSDETWQREIERLRIIYHDSLARTDEWADDALFVWTRRNLGTILAMLGGLPEGLAGEPDADEP